MCSGLLLKTGDVEESAVEAMDTLLVLVLVLAFTVVVYAVIQQFITVSKALKRARYCGVVLQRLPQEDP